jgi:hypothetical protein
MGNRKNQQKKGTGAPPQKKTRTGESSSSSSKAKPQQEEGAKPPAPKTAPIPPPLEGTFAAAAAGTTTRQSRAPTPVLVDTDMASRAASPNGTAAKDTTDTTDTPNPQATQSAGDQKASSGPKGTKRRLAIPEWSLGESLFRVAESLFRVAEWDSYMRRPPKVCHKYVAFASLQGSSLKACDVIRAAIRQFGKKFIASDVFAASQQVAICFLTAELADDAAASGLILDETTTLPLSRRADYQPQIRKLTVSNVDSTSPKEAVHALKQHFTPYGRVLDITPRYWLDSHVHNGVWHVTLDVKQCKVNQAPPEIDVLLGHDIFIDVPGFQRVCRHCMSAVHSRKDCQTWKRLQARPDALAAYERNIASDARLAAHDAARQSQQHQQQKQQQQRQKQQQKQQPQQQQKQPSQEKTADPVSDEEFVQAMLRRIDETTDRLRIIFDDDHFEHELDKALRNYEAVATSREVALPSMTEVASEWQDARLAYLLDLSEKQAREDAANRGDTSFTSETMEDAGNPADDTSSESSEEPLTILPTSTLVPVVEVPVPPSPPSYTGMGTAERGVISPPPGPQTRSFTRRNA